MAIRYRVTPESAVTALVAVGLVLRVWQYAANPSLWYDEISIARNITQRSFGDLVSGPLLYMQVAPVGFIAAVKLATIVLGASDLALRFVPFVCGIVALLLFRRLAEQALSGVAVPIAVGLFAFAPPLGRARSQRAADRPTMRRRRLGWIRGHLVLASRHPRHGRTGRGTAAHATRALRSHRGTLGVGLDLRCRRRTTLCHSRDAGVHATVLDGAACVRVLAAATVERDAVLQ